MNIALITRRASNLEPLRQELLHRHFRAETFADVRSCQEAARSFQWSLAILDGASFPFQEVAAQLIEVDASIHLAVLTDLEAEAFHEASEGLGILCAMRLAPSQQEIDELLEKLRSVGGLPPELEAAQSQLGNTRKQLHEYCVVCSKRHPLGLHAGFRAVGEHAVEATFPCAKGYEGYRNVIHGGIVSSLLDGAMANCIFAKGLEAYTVDLRIRFRAPVEVGVEALVRGEWLRSEGKLHLLQASVTQNGKVRASARAKFMEGSPNATPTPMPRGAATRTLLKESHQRAR